MTRKQRKKLFKWASKPSYMSHKVFCNYLVAIRKSKVTLTHNKPTYVRMCILELSKVLMYESHYCYIENKYGNNSRIYTNTDSLMYEIKTGNIYEGFIKDKTCLIL